MIQILKVVKCHLLNSYEIAGSLLNRHLVKLLVEVGMFIHKLVHAYLSIDSFQLYLALVLVHQAIVSILEIIIFATLTRVIVIVPIFKPGEPITLTVLSHGIGLLIPRRITMIKYADARSIWPESERLVAFVIVHIKT